VLLPGPAKVTPDLGFNGLELLVCQYTTILYHNSCGFVLVNPSLGCHNVLLVIHGFPDHNHAVLEDSGCITKDKVNSSRDHATPVELPMSLDIQGVLVSFESAVQEN
ncbi:hypothetical protein CFOL_v3_14484, partial [Cephalotus follicularis]